MKFFLCISLFFVLLSIDFPAKLHAHSRTEPLAGATLNGYVSDAETKETLVSASVSVKKARLGAYSNKSGFYVVRNIPAGKFVVSVSFLGYATKEIEVDFKDGESKTLNVALSPKSVQSQGVSVEADREVEKRQIAISQVNIPVQQLEKIRIGGEADVFRAIQMLPGVLTSSQISSGLYIRGGSPDQNLVLIDGSTVYNPSHLLGFISAFNSDAIKDIDLIKGGFPAEYGGRLSAVLNLTQKDGNQKEFEGLASIGAISSKLALQGPVGNGSWFVSARRTYLDLILALVPEDADNPLPDFNFYDINAKISQTLSPNDRIFASGFLSRDKLGLGSSGVSFNVGIGNRSASLRWTHIFGDNLFSVVNLSGSHYDNGFDANNSGFVVAADNTITDYTLKTNFEWFASESVTAKFGFESTRYTFTYFQNFTGTNDSTSATGADQSGKLNLEVNDWVHSVYAQANHQFNDLFSFQAGLRGTYIDLRGMFTLDPRLAFRYQVQENFGIKASWGLFHQYLRLAAAPDFSFFDTWLPTDSTVTPSSAYHYILSFDSSPWENIDFNVDFYYKKMRDVSELNQFATGAKTVGQVFFIGNAESYGMEIFLQKKAGNFVGWVGYGLGFINATFDSINGGREFRPKYDRRHDFKVVAQYKINDRWEIGSSFTFQTGQSYTASTSRFQSYHPGENIGVGVTIPAQRYGLRLPPSHQLNLNANYNTTFFGLPARLLIDIYNVYSRRDIWFRNYRTTEEKTEVTDVLLLPIIPTVAFEVKF